MNKKYNTFRKKNTVINKINDNRQPCYIYMGKNKSVFPRKDTSRTVVITMRPVPIFYAVPETGNRIRPARPGLRRLLLLVDDGRRRGLTRVPDPVLGSP